MLFSIRIKYLVCELLSPFFIKIRVSKPVCLLSIFIFCNFATAFAQVPDEITIRSLLASKNGRVWIRKGFPSYLGSHCDPGYELIRFYLDGSMKYSLCDSTTRNSYEQAGYWSVNYDNDIHNWKLLTNINTKERTFTLILLNEKAGRRKIKLRTTDKPFQQKTFESVQ